MILTLFYVVVAIDACRQQLSSPVNVGTSHECFKLQRQQQSECSEQTSRSSHGTLVLEEFIPIKKFQSCSSEDANSDVGDEEDHEQDESGEKLDKKSDWLKSVQLWNQSSNPADHVPEVFSFNQFIFKFNQSSDF